MGHLASRDAYKNLEDRINWFTQGAPVSDTLYKILQVLYTEKEAKWVALLPVRPFTAKKAARIWQTSEAKAEKFLTHLCEKALLVDSYHNGVRKFVMPPPMAGFIEFALMRTRGDIDQKYLSELYYQYMNVEEDFVKDLFFVTETRLGRVFVQEPVLTNPNTLHILDHERASHIVEEAEYIGLGTCYCRHKMLHAGHPCEIDAPLDVCLTFGNVARSLAEHGGYARLIDKAEAMDALERSYAHNLVQIGENVREDPAFIWDSESSRAPQNARLYVHTGVTLKPGTAYRVGFSLWAEQAQPEYAVRFDGGARESAYGTLDGRSVNAGGTDKVQYQVTPGTANGELVLCLLLFLAQEAGSAPAAPVLYDQSPSCQQSFLEDALPAGYNLPDRHPVPVHRYPSCP